MSISTGRGDEGETDLFFGRRVPKTHARIEACGSLDELNAALGLARVSSEQAFTNEILASLQDDLVIVMGEIATLSADLPRYREKGFSVVESAMVERLSGFVEALETGKGIAMSDWALPGAGGHAGGAALDFARTLCRRAERRIAGLVEDGEVSNPALVSFVNRLSDVLWLLARFEEREARSR